MRVLMTAIAEHQRNGAEPAYAIVDPAQVPMTPARVAMRRLVQWHVERVSQLPVYQARHRVRRRALQCQHAHREPAAAPPHRHSKTILQEKSLRYFAAILLSRYFCSRSPSTGSLALMSAKSGPPKQPVGYRARGMAAENASELP